jgi:rhamnosyltransferase subunit B
MRSGRPMLFVPYGWDQPDNGLRVERQGAGLCLPRAQYSVETATAALARLLCDPGFATYAAKLGAQMASENAMATACDAIESML